MRQQWMHDTSLTSEMTGELSRLTCEGENLHTELRKDGDWSKIKDRYAYSFALMPSVGEIKKNRLGASSVYEALMDSFSPGLKDETVVSEFAKLEKVLPGMISVLNLLSCRRRYRSLHSRLSPAHLFRSLQLGAKSGHRNSWQSDNVHGPPRPEVDRQMSDGLIVGSLDDGNEVALPQDRILRDNVATEVGNLLIYLLQTVRILVQSLAPLRRQGAQQNIRWHGMPSLLSPPS
jgi:hypothetical protein